jgi:hypothetical protein
MHRFAAAFRLCVLVFVCACVAFAQRDLATITGTVTDSSGGVVPNARVTITETGTGQVYQLTTNAAGEFTRPALKPSTYNVTVAAPGFKQFERRDVVLTAGDRTGVNISLSLGDIGQTVEVSASAQLLQTESTQIGAALILEP